MRDAQLLESKTTRASAEFCLVCRGTAIQRPHYSPSASRNEQKRADCRSEIKNRLILPETLLLKLLAARKPSCRYDRPPKFCSRPSRARRKKKLLRFLEQAQGSRNGRPLKESASGMIPSAQVPRQRGERKGLGEDELTQSFQQRARGP